MTRAVTPPSSAAPGVAGEPFPGPGDFAEGYTPQSRPVLNGLQSMYTGTLAVTMMDRAAAARVLPEGVRLATPRNPSARHPVIHLVGDQLEPSTLTLGRPVQVGEGYREMILLVPYVLWNGGSGLYNFAVRMFLTDSSAVTGGNEVFGYAKVRAELERIEASPRTTYQVTTVDGSSTWVLAEIQLTSQWGQAPGSLPRWTDLRDIFRIPVLGLRPADKLRPAIFICSHWEWSFAQAELAAARSQIRFVTKFHEAADDWVAAGPLASAPDGAVSMRRVRWRLAIPPSGS